VLRSHIEDNFVRAQHGGGNFGRMAVRHLICVVFKVASLSLVLPSAAKAALPRNLVGTAEAVP
jgi:hypothetical protein